MIHLIARRPLTLSGYSGPYSTEWSSELKPETVLAGSAKEKYAFQERVDMIVAHMKTLHDIECEAVICCILGPTQNTYTGNIEVWSDSHAPAAREAINNINRLCEEIATLGSQSTATIKLTLSRSAVKKAA